MDTYDSIKKRRSVRSYLNKNVAHKDIVRILEAGHFAPSPANLQNWRFIVVRENNKEELSRCCLSQLWMCEASVWIVICSDNEKLKKEYPKNWKKFSVQSCAAAIQNMLIEATSLGLSSCWISISNEQKFKNILKIPDDIEVEGLITLGYGSEKPMEKRKKLEFLTLFESFGNRSRDVSLFPLVKHLKK